MYLAPALKLAIPYAILDRADMARAHGYQGKEAEEAEMACTELKALQGVKPAVFTSEQRETARLALIWGEQYLEGYIDALDASDKSELAVSHRHRGQIRKVRFQYFGQTKGEAMSEHLVAVDIREAFVILKARAALLGNKA